MMICPRCEGFCVEFGIALYFATPALAQRVGLSAMNGRTIGTIARCSL